MNQLECWNFKRLCHHAEHDEHPDCIHGSFVEAVFQLLFAYNRSVFYLVV